MTLVLASALCLLGAAGVVAGVALVSLPLSLAAAGAFTLALGCRIGLVATGGRK